MPIATARHHGGAAPGARPRKQTPMLTDKVKYWLAVAAIMLLMWGYSGRLSTALIFGIAAVGAFVYWQVTARRRKRALEAAQHEERPRGV
jgi:hypothetical protein